MQAFYLLVHYNSAKSDKVAVCETEDIMSQSALYLCFKALARYQCKLSVMEALRRNPIFSRMDNLRVSLFTLTIANRAASN